MKHKTINLILTISLATILTSGAVLATTTSTPTSTVDIRHTQIINDTQVTVDSSNGSVQIIRNNYSQAIQKYQEGKGVYIGIKQKFSVNQSLELKQQVVSTGRHFLIRCDETLINYLDNLKTKLMTAGILTGNRISATNQEFNNLVQELLAKKDTLEQINSQDELKNHAQALKQKWHEIKYLTRLSKAEALSTKMRKMINKLDAYGGEINTKINELDEQAINTESIKEAFVKFNENLLQIKVFFNNAQSSFATLQETGDMDYFDQGLTHLKQSKAMMKLVKKSLNEVIEELKRI